jgi:hypothetical protein
MTQPNLDQLNADILAEFSTYTVQYKANSALMKLFNVLLIIVTFGQSKSFMTSFVTTIWTTVYVPSSWDSLNSADKCVLLRHERVHMRQARNLGRWRFALTYMLWPLPILLAKGRASLEMEAYTETLRAWNDYGANILQTGFRVDIISNFTTGAYGWMWPFPRDIGDWYNSAAKQVLAGK